MNEDMKDEIRSRMSKVTHIYRGNDLPELIEEADSGVVEGGTHRVWTSEQDIVVPSDVEGREMQEISFVESTEVPVTGGFSDSLAQTHNFNGAANTSLVLNSAGVGVSPIEYDYNYYNQHPGVYAHVRSSISAELRQMTNRGDNAPLGDLVGFTNTGPRSARDTTMVETVDRVELDGNDLPGTSTNSLIAQESEWVSESKTVDIGGAIEGFVTINEPVGIRVAYAKGKDINPGDAPPVSEIVEDVYRKVNQNVPDKFDHYLLVVDRIGDATDRDPEAFPERTIEYAVGPSGRQMPPADVPQHFRGVNV